jgi:hypothetical protein
MPPYDKQQRLLELQRELAVLRSELGVQGEPGEQQRSFAHASQELLRLEAERVGQLGTWTWDLTSGVIAWSQELYRILGLSERDR